jgi:hypothetical protein
LRWRHNGTPPDLHLQLVRDPQLWFDFGATLPLDALTRHDPQLRRAAPHRHCGLTPRIRVAVGIMS